MMRYIYTAGIYIYGFLVFIAAVFNKKAAVMIRGRKDSFSRIRNSFDRGDRVFWFHCASLGEFEQGRPLIERIKTEQPGIKILLTFYSPSGYLQRYNYDKADCVVFLPADTPRNARKMIRLANPEKVIFIKYEFWFNYLRILQKKRIPVYLVSGIFRRSQFFFRCYGKYFLAILRGFTHLFIQDENSARLLREQSITNYSVSGDTRFDRVAAVSRAAADLPLIDSFGKGHRLIVAGSSWPAEEEMLSEYMDSGRDDLRCIIAPHNTDDSNIERIENILKVPSCRYSRLEAGVPPGVKVLIIDSIGLLSSVYRYAGVAVIGGGFGRGIHNILEAAAWGVPLMFGPRHQKFREAHDLIRLKGAKVFDNYAGFSSAMDLFLDDHLLREESGKINKAYVDDNRGATEAACSELLTGNC